MEPMDVYKIWSPKFTILWSFFLRSYGKDITNIHHGLLPSFSGSNPSKQTEFTRYLSRAFRSTSLLHLDWVPMTIVTKDEDIEEKSGLCWLVAVMMGGYERGSIGNGWCTRVDDGCPGWCLERLWPEMIGLDTSVMGDIVMCRSSYGAWWWSKMVGLDTLAIEVIGSLRRLEGEGGKRRSNH
ncbi:hypothetical protein JHK82_015972 [Glycine max]|nr:hypothetical protein JHK85_016368 [Glycine max]KAG5046590.1 hypothetical protein JHK86_015996 [Glycine max]KAG5149091.1 hypothetical protein JHK82_015972 [Glycine max]